MYYFNVKCLAGVNMCRLVVGRVQTGSTSRFKPLVSYVFLPMVATDELLFLETCCSFISPLWKLLPAPQSLRAAVLHSLIEPERTLDFRCRNVERLATARHSRVSCQPSLPLPSNSSCLFTRVSFRQQAHTPENPAPPSSLINLSSFKDLFPSKSSYTTN